MVGFGRFGRAAAAVSFTVVAFAGAAVAAAPAATLTKVSGIVRIIPAGSPTALPAKVGGGLEPGDTVATANGRAELTFAEGHIVRLNANTTLKVSPPPDAGAKKGGFTRLFALLMGGSLKALVKPVKPGDNFAIESVQAIASVKGTEFFFDGGVVQVRDEKDAARHEVRVIDLRSLREELVGEGQEGGFRPDGSALDPHAIGDDIFQKLDQQVEAEEHGAEGTAAAGAAGSAGGAGGAGEGSATDALRGEMHEELAEFSNADWVGQWSDNQERRTDTELGKVLHDRHGDWVRMDEQIVQTASNEVSLIVLNERQTGPNRGTSKLMDVVDFNADLPSDQFADIYRTYPSYLLDPNTYPSYFAKAETVTYQNPFGDHVRQEYLFSDPILLWDSYTKAFHTPLNNASFDGVTYAVDAAISAYADSHWVYMPDTNFGSPTNWGQAVEQRVWAGTDSTDVLKEHYKYSEYGDLNAGWYAGVNAYMSAGEMYDSYSTPLGISYVDHNYQPIPLGTFTLWAYTMQQDPNSTLFPFDPDRNDMNTYVNYGMPVLNTTTYFPDRNTDFGVYFNDPAGPSIQGWRSQWWDGNGYVTLNTYADGSWLANRFGMIDDQGNELDPYAWYDRFNYEVEWASSDFSTDPDTGLLRTVDLVLDPDIFNNLHDSNVTSVGTTNATTPQ